MARAVIASAVLNASDQVGGSNLLHHAPPRIPSADRIEERLLITWLSNSPSESRDRVHR